MHIEIPDGFEVDLDKSEISSGSICFKPKKDRYKELCETLFMGSPVYFIQSNSEVIKVSSRLDLTAASNSVNPEQLRSILSLNKLCNVAKVLNKNWSPRTIGAKYFIYLRGVKRGKNEISIGKHSMVRHSVVYFSSERTAAEAIKILGEETIIDSMYLNS